MIKFIEKLDQHMSVKTWVANPAARSVSDTPTKSFQPTREQLLKHPSNANLDQIRRQPSMEVQRKLKEQRLAELARQLDLTQLQNDLPRAKHAPRAPSSSLSPIRKLSPEPLYPPISDADLEWQERQRKVEEINKRIELLRSSGLPQDRIPSPVHLPSRSASRARMDRVDLTSTLPHDYHAPPSSSSTIDRGLRSQPSQRTLNSPSSFHTLKSMPSFVQKDHSHDQSRSLSSSQVGYSQTLNDAETLIARLRTSHEDLLERSNDLENQLKLREEENRDLVTRNRRLEVSLLDEQIITKKLQIENERLLSQLKSHSFSPQGKPFDHHPEPQHQHAQVKSQFNQPHSQATYDVSQRELESRLHNPASAGAELLHREENLQKHFANNHPIPPTFNHSTPPIRPEPIQPGSHLRSHNSPHAPPAHTSNIVSSNNDNRIGGHDSSKTSLFRSLPNSQSHSGRAPDPAIQNFDLTDEINRSHDEASSANLRRRFGSNRLDNHFGRSPYQQDLPVPPHGPFGSHNFHQSNDQLPLPPFLNDGLPWNYHNAACNPRPQPFPAYGYF